MKRRRKNIYTHEIELTDLSIKNRPREDFMRLLEQVQYKGYEVEQLADGRKIVITKPGGKFTYGRIRREDFMVWIYNPSDKALWLITHEDIKKELEDNSTIYPEEKIKIIDALERVYNGEDPEDVMSSVSLENPEGESPEILLKAYKWIWGQEDCNYPDGKGRAYSWEGWKKVGSNWVRTGGGIVDIRERLRNLIKNRGSQ